MSGTRRPDDTECHLLGPLEYAKQSGDGSPFWYACTPSGMLANLSLHRVDEHDDGTITVAPSILVHGHAGEWHGYLERGVWRSC